MVSVNHIAAEFSSPFGRDALPLRNRHGTIGGSESQHSYERTADSEWNHYKIAAGTATANLKVSVMVAQPEKSRNHRRRTDFAVEIQTSIIGLVPPNRCRGKRHYAISVIEFCRMTGIIRGL